MLKKFLRYLLFIIIVLCFNRGLARFSAPGSLILKNYAPVLYKAHGQNWDIVQDKTGLIYFANSNGILEFDGLNWRKYEIPNQLVRALAVDENNRIYVGGADELGFLEQDDNGKRIYVSLKEKLPARFREFGHIFKIWLIQNKVIFQTYSHITTFTKSEKDKLKLLQVLPAITSFHRSFVLNNRMYILQRENGLMRYEGGSLIPVAGTKHLHDSYLYAAVQFSPEEKKILLGFIPEGFFWFDGKKMAPFQTEADSILFQKNRYLSALPINQEEFAVGTLSEGCVILNRNGQLVKNINKRDGLQNPTVFALYRCKNNYLWMGLDHGISRVDLNAPLEIIDNRSGIWGVPSSICLQDSTLYVGTGIGVFYCNLSENNQKKNRFTKLFGSADQCWAIAKRKNSIVVANRLGLYEVIGGKIQPIHTGWSFEKPAGSSPYSLFKMPVRLSGPEYWLVGLLDGLAVLVRDENGWKDLGKIAGIDFEVRAIGVDHNGDYWLASSYQGLLRVRFKKLFPKPVIKRTWHYINRDDISNYWVSLLMYQDSLIFVDKEGFSYFDYDTEQFKAHNSLNGSLFKKGVVANKAQTDDDGNIWLSAYHGNELILFKRLNNSTHPEWRPFTRFPLSQIVSPFASIIDFEFGGKPASLLWMATSEGILQFNLENQKVETLSKKDTLVFRQITFKNDSVFYWGVGPVPELKLPYSENAVRFDLANLNFNDPSNNQYRYYLEGFDQNWHGWSDETDVVYTNLPPGKYTLRVQSRSSSGRQCRLSYSFTVLTPWYLHWVAILVYILCGIGATLLIIKWRVRHLEKERQRLENIVAHRTRELVKQKNVIELQKKKLEELDAAKTRFFENLSHELRTPITLVLGQVDLISRKVKQKEVKDKLAVIGNNAKILLNLINQLLTASKLHAKELPLQMEFRDLVGFVRKRVYAFESLALEKGIELGVVSQEDRFETKFDPEKIEKVIYNLISNALKFTPSGGKITVSISRSHDMERFVQIKILDTGIGIPKEKLPFIFERFFQAHDGQKRFPEGTGLGLAIVKEFVEIQGGYITVESEMGKGSCFTIRLPISDAETGKGGALAKENLSEESLKLNREAASQSNRPLVLVVDDNSDMRAYIGECLENEYKVEFAGNGRIGLEKALQKMPDLIISDMLMPEMNGLDLIKKIRKDPRTSHIPVIMLTAKAGEENKIKGLESGADAYLTKPFNQKEILIRIRQLIQIRQALRAKFSQLALFQPEEVSGNAVDQEFIKKVQRIIKDNYHDAGFGVEQLAYEIGMSVSQLNRKLKALIGQTAGNLIRQSRLEQAAVLLSGKRYTVGEIAVRVGFADVSAFSKSFKAKYGKAPSQFTPKSVS